MSFENGLQATESMQAKADRIKHCGDKSTELGTRLHEQAEVVSKTEEKLAELVNARKPNSDKPDELVNANIAIKKQAEKVEEERELLDAVQTAVRNAEQQRSDASNGLAGSIRHAISNAALPLKDRVSENLFNAMQEYFTIHYALKGTLTGAQYEVEQLSRDRSLGVEAGKRIAGASLKLREAVNVP